MLRGCCQRTTTRLALVLGLALGGLAPGEAQALPSTADDIACRPNGNSTDAVDVTWVDTNSDNADYDLERQLVGGGGNWSLVDTLAAGGCADDGSCSLTDLNADTTDVYRYRVIAREGTDEAPPTSSCREPLWLDSQSGNFRIYYRLSECPSVDGDQVCTQNIDDNGQNKHASQMASIFEQYRTEYLNMGFSDAAVFGGGKPFPVDLFPCNNGCANSRGIQIPPEKLEASDYDPDTGAGNDFEYFIPGHELFHKTQGAHGGSSDPFYKWVIEGQARAMEDKACVFNQTQCGIWDDNVDKFYDGQMAAYLGQPEVGLQEQSYNAAIFWVKVMERFASVTNEPELGSDVMVKFWEQNEDNDIANDEKDGIGTLNDTLSIQLGSAQQFEDVFSTFAAANYAKDYIASPVPAGLEDINYIDEETFPGGTYGPVKLTSSGPLAAGQAVFGTHSVDAWGARYFEVDPDASVSVVIIEVEALPATQHPMYFHVFGIQNGDITLQQTATGTSFSHSIPNIGPTYDRVALVVAALGHQTNFDWGFNLGDGLFIKTPTGQFPAAVGEATAPKKFVLRVEVLDEAGDPVLGINPHDFVIEVDGTQIHPTVNPANSPIVSAAFIAGQYWLSVRAPSTPSCDPCDLTVAYADYTDTKADALDYGPVPDSDNMIVIDRSGSMAGAKIAAAKEAGNLYVDAYDVGDRVGVLSYNETTNLEFSLTDWTLVSRAAAQAAIDGMAVPGGNTAIGLGLRDAQQELIDEAAPNPAWSMVLLSDGADTVADENDHLPAFISEYEARKDDGDQVPIVHVVAVGDDADGVALEELVEATNGTFQWLVDVDQGTVSDEEFSNELGEIYRTFAEEVLDEQQVTATRDQLVQGVIVNPIQVDAAASQGIFVAKWSPQSATPPFVALMDPDGLQVGAPTLSGAGHRLWRIPAPKAGEWQMVIRPCSSVACANDFLTEAAVVSDLTLEGFLGLEKDERLAGRPMPVVALLSDVDPLVGASVSLEVPRTGEVRTMFDDGNHGDGEANDGFYGATILNTNAAGGYTVLIKASGVSPLSGAFERRRRLGFFMKGEPDDDGDGTPSWWEEEHGTDPDVPEPREHDPDKDGLTTRVEFANTKTHPLDADTDDGGENDGSEVGRGADPHDPGDDLIRQPAARAWAGVEQVRVRFSAGPSSPRGPLPPRAADIYGARRRSGVLGPFQLLASNEPVASREWIDHIATNWDGPPDGGEYCYCVIARAQLGAVQVWSTPSSLTCARPGSDPNPPHGEIDLLPPATHVPDSDVMLALTADDDPTTEEHQPFDGAILDPLSSSSGVAEMQVANRADFDGAVWQPYQNVLPWTLAPNPHGRAHVFARYRDGAGNVSDTVAVSVQVPEPAMLLLWCTGLLVWLSRRHRRAA